MPHVEISTHLQNMEKRDDSWGIIVCENKKRKVKKPSAMEQETGRAGILGEGQAHGPGRVEAGLAHGGK